MKNSECGIYVEKRLYMKTMNRQASSDLCIKQEFVLENVYDKPMLQTTKTVVSFP